MHHEYIHSPRKNGLFTKFWVYPAASEQKKVSIRLLDLKWYNSSCRLSDKNKRRAEKHSPILYEPRLPTAEGKALKQFDNNLHQDPH